MFCVNQHRCPSWTKLCGMCLKRTCVLLLLSGMFWTCLLGSLSLYCCSCPLFWYWVIDLEVLSPVEITSQKFSVQSPLPVLTSHIEFSDAGCTQSYVLPLSWSIHHLILPLLLVKGFILQSVLSGVSVAIPTVFGYRCPFLSLCVLKSAASVGTQHRVDLGCLQIHSATLCFFVLMRLIFYMQSDYW